MEKFLELFVGATVQNLGGNIEYVTDARMERSAGTAQKAIRLKVYRNKVNITCLLPSF